MSIVRVPIPGKIAEFNLLVECDNCHSRASFDEVNQPGSSWHHLAIDDDSQICDICNKICAQRWVADNFER